MTQPDRRRTARASRLGRSALVAVALAVVVAGCTEDPVEDAPTSTSTSASTGAVSQDAGSAPPPAPVESETEGGVGPPNLSGLGTDVTPEQLEFAERNTLGGMDAAAVLVAGEDTCKRMTALQDNGGQESLVAAMVAGDFANHADAVALLCPELAPAAEVASTGFADGETAVASAPGDGQAAPGRYRTLQAGPSCTWTQTRSGVVVRTGGGGEPAVELLDGDAITSSGCYAWVR